ncbi:MAG: iron chelate uptake ABC transporter family permease subunit [Alphaproteobacteria bacterium]|nr:iron chelate uptake ABC transporter family permease subunit [Alphaproteobacteria bacterium]
MDDFLIRAAIGGIGVAAVTGPLGAFVVWRRMAYFGDALAHSALLGVALGLLIGSNTNVSIIAVCIAVALLLVALQRQRYLASDTVLGILAHGTLSLGLVVVALQGSVRVDLFALLFGDVLAMTVSDLYWIYGGGVVALALLLWLWRPLLAVTVHEDLARVEGVNVVAVQLGFMVVIALVIAVAIKIVGILLLTSLLVIPAAAARRVSSTPEMMAILAALIGTVSVIGGLSGSLQWDTPAGPSVVLAAVVLFALVMLLPAGRRT